jgi:hypothetical protein
MSPAQTVVERKPTLATPSTLLSTTNIILGTAGMIKKIKKIISAKIPDIPRLKISDVSC